MKLLIINNAKGPQLSCFIFVRNQKYWNSSSSQKESWLDTNNFTWKLNYFICTLHIFKGIDVKLECVYLIHYSAVCHRILPDQIYSSYFYSQKVYFFKVNIQQFVGGKLDGNANSTTYKLLQNLNTQAYVEQFKDITIYPNNLSSKWKQFHY